jgi:hypothetical protein
MPAVGFPTLLRLEGNPYLDAPFIRNQIEGHASIARLWEVLTKPEFTKPWMIDWYSGSGWLPGSPLHREEAVVERQEAPFVGQTAGREERIWKQKTDRWTRVSTATVHEQGVTEIQNVAFLAAMKVNA